MQEKTFRLSLQLCLLCYSLLCGALSFAEGNVVQVYRMQYQTADALLPAVDGVLHDGESVNAFNNELVVNATASTQRTVQSLLQQLDYPPRNLMISVRNNSDGSVETDSRGLSGGIRTGKVYVGAGRPVVTDGGLVIRQDGAQVHVDRSHRSTSADSGQQVRVIEGHPAWISTGQSAPVRSVDLYGHPTSEYVNADQGFYVTARLVGDRVQLTISATHDRFSNTRRGVVDTQQVNTSVSGNIGEWITLGTIQTDIRDRDSTYTSRERTTGSSITGIAVRVVPAD